MHFVLKLIISLLLLPSFAFTQEISDSIGIVTNIQGNSPNLTRDNQNIQLVEKFELMNGDLVKTDSQSLLRIKFTDGSIIVLGNNSELKISEYSYNSEKRTANYTLNSGKLKSYISNKTASKAGVIFKTTNTNSVINTGYLYVDASSEMHAIEKGGATISSTNGNDQITLSKNEYSIYKNNLLDGPSDTTGIIWSNFDDLTSLSLNPDGIDENQSLSNTNYVLEDNAIGIITLVEGESNVITDDKELVAKEGLNVFIGTEIETFDNALVKIIFIDDSTIVLADNAYLELTEFIFNKNKRVNKTKLLSGKMKSFTKKYIDKNSTGEIKTTNAVAGVKGTILYVDGDEELFGVEKGEVEVTGSKDKKNKVTIKDGQYTKVNGGIASAPKKMTTAIWKPFNKLLDIPVVNKVPFVKSVINAPKKLLKLIPFF